MPLEYGLQFIGQFPDPGPWKAGVAKPYQPKAYVGIDVVPRQLVNRLKKKPYVFNLMVVGESGLGKTTFINTLFHSTLKDLHFKNVKETKTVKVERTSFDISEGSVNMRLSVIDTPGFGDKLNRQDDLTPILDYLQEQNKIFLEAERFRNFRYHQNDNRVHLILYFLTPFGGKVKEMDMDSLKKLSQVANVIPVIGKADCLTADERKLYKDTIIKQLAKNEIRTYPFDFCEDRASISHLETFIPFAVVGSNQLVEYNGKRVRGRVHRWGVVDVENEQHCDFVHLRELIMSRNLHDLVFTTNEHHYSKFRSSYLRKSQRSESVLLCDDDYVLKLEDSRQKLFEDLAKKESEIKEMFVQKVKEKEAHLREAEENLIIKKDELISPLLQKQKEIASELASIDEQLKQLAIKKK